MFAVLTFWLDARVTDSIRAQKASLPAPDHFMEGFQDRNEPMQMAALRAP